MLNKLLANPESRSIETVEGSITEVQLPRTFDAVICVFNTLCTLISQEDQLQALLKAAAHLRPDGLLILENSSPVHALRGFRFNHALAAPGVGCMNGDEFFMVAAEHFPIEQLVRMRYLFLSTRGTEIFPVDLRYIWPAELDMMAQVAGFRLIRRYGGWPAQPFTEASEMHIECYAKISISGDNAKGGR